MSGEKEVRLREGEYHRLMGAARQVDANQSHIRAMNKQLEQARKSMQRSQREADSRQKALQRSIGSLSGELQAATRDFQQGLERQRAAFSASVEQLDQQIAAQGQAFARSVDQLDQRIEGQRREFKQRADQLDQRISTQRDEYLDLNAQQSARADQLDQRLERQRLEFTERAQQLDQRIANQRQEYLGLIAQQAAYVEKQFARLDQQERSAQQRAEQWIGDARVILDYIEQHQRHQQFAPGELEALKGELNQSRANVQQGHHQAAIATAQALYGKALKLQAEIEYRQLEWDTYHAEALKGARACLAELEVQETAQWAFDTEQGQHELAAEIDYWNDGALSALKHRVLAALETLERPGETLTLDDLKAQIAANQTLQAELADVITRAKERLIASQVRVNIAEDLLGDLEQSGWQLQDSVWQGEAADAGKGWKNSYHLKLQDLGGNEMITIILPEDTPRGQIENRVQFAYFPKNNNDARFAAAQTERLGNTLAKLGLTQERLQCVPGHERTIRGDEVRRDFETIRVTPPEPVRVRG